MSVFKFALGAFLALFLPLQLAFGADALPPCDQSAQRLVTSLQREGFELVGTKQVPVGEVAVFARGNEALLILATPVPEAAQQLEKQGWTRLTECQSPGGPVVQILRHEASAQKPGGPT